MSSLFDVKLKLRAAITAGRTTVQIRNISERVGLSAEAPDDHTYDFYVGAWMGNDNPHMQFEMLKGCPDGSGVASLSIPVLQGDTNALKIGVYIRDPKTRMMRHLASCFQTLSWFGDAIHSTHSISDAKASLLLKDNYSSNQVLLHFCDDGTDIPKMRRLSSALPESYLSRSEDSARRSTRRSWT